MTIKNFTPLANFRYANEDAAWRLFDILIIKATFTFDENWVPVLCKEQEPLWFTDIYYGHSETSAIRYPSDVVPFKPATDVILNASAFAPSDVGLPRWTAGFAVMDRQGQDRLSKAVSVSGPYDWTKGPLTWTAASPSPAQSVPIRYENAFGGRQNTETDAEKPENIVVLETNPVGRGWVADKKLLSNAPYTGPQITVSDEQVKPFQNQDVAGFGAIPPAWLPRRPLGGTYDQDWIDNVWPHWAADYDFAFHNSAPKDQQLSGYLNGDETFALSCLMRGGKDRTIALPGWTPFLHVINSKEDIHYVRPHLDTVILDIPTGEPGASSLFLSWRYVFLKDDVTQINIDLDCPEKPGINRRYGLTLDPAPTPADLFKHKEAA